MMKRLLGQPGNGQGFGRMHGVIPDQRHWTTLGKCSKLAQTRVFNPTRAGQNKRMKQTDLNLDLSNRRTRKRVFLNEMERVVPWHEFVALIAAHAPTKATGRRPFPIEAMLRIHFLQQWILPSKDAPLLQRGGGCARKRNTQITKMEEPVVFRASRS
jgi:hypothetical protein